MVFVEATVTSKGQVTIPKPVREDLHLRSGSKVMFVSSPEGVVMRPKSDDPIRDLIRLSENHRNLSESEIKELMAEEKRCWSKL